jgi:hypothetical protein
MSQVHLYGNPFIQKNGPDEWQSISVESTVNDTFLEAGIDEQELTFSGPAGEFIKEWVETPNKGTFNGIPYRIIYESETSPGTSSIRFDGFIDLYNFVYLSRENPVIIKAPVKRIDNPKSVIEKMAVLTEGVLVQKGWLNSSHYVDVPVIRESKKNVADRALIIYNFGAQVVTAFTQIANNIVGAIGNILGVAVVVGVIELLLVFVNAVIVINQLFQQGMLIRDLIWPQISYYKATSMKTFFTQAYGYKGYSVDFGILDTWMSKTYLLASQNEFDGYFFQGFPATGELKPQDWGYIVGQRQETLQEMLKLRIRVVGNTVHIKTKNDPYWFQTPVYVWDNVKVATAGWHQNGEIKFDTERVKGTVMINYAYDASDTHTLTAKTGDSHEVRRELINELNPKLNTLKGIEEINIPWAMAVRKQPFDNLWDLFNGVSGDFDIYLNKVKAQITSMLGHINSSGVDVADEMADILSAVGIGGLLANREGCLKIDDNAYAIPKLLWLDDYTVGKRIPTNFKDFIGARTLYENYHKWESPADVSGFAGQYQKWMGVQLPWSYTKFNQTQNNPYFLLQGHNAKFLYVDWIEAEHSAVTDIEQQKPFDTNITEIEI